MARVCQICGKGYLNTIKRSHSMQANKVRLYPNLQWLRLEHGRKVKACVKCMKTHQRKIAQPRLARLASRAKRAFEAKRATVAA